MERKICLALQKYHMLDGQSKIAVAFSGGADSSALLYYFKTNGFDVSAIHVNHMIRGNEADRDEQFCRDFCLKLGIPFYPSRVNVPQFAAQNGIGTEQAARELRYRELYRISRENSFNRLATAHHANDNAETVLFNMTRGSGGSCGIPPVRDDFIIRPLILASRSEILGYCEKHGIKFVTDSTNLDTDYTRNYIRHEILPRLEKINPDAVGAISRLAESSRRDAEFIDKIVADMPDDMPRNKLSQLHDAVLSRYIIRLSKQKSITPSAANIGDAVRLTRDGNSFHTLDLPGAVMVFDRDRIYLTDTIKTNAENTEIFLNDGENPWQADNGLLVISKATPNGDKYKNIYKNSTHTDVNFGTIKGNLFVRTRRSGDRCRVNGVNRSVKKLMCDLDIPVLRRPILPVICDDEGVVWIPGLCRRDQKDKTADKTLCLTYFYDKKG